MVHDQTTLWLLGLWLKEHIMVGHVVKKIAHLMARR
jgi:hypothetical protein